MKQFITYLIVWLSIAVTASAETTYEEIAHWENGYGITENGERITGGWGYDEESAAGKYVLFDAEGRVKQKKDSLQQSLPMEEQFTDTEVENGVVAVRGNVFTGFEGRIYVTFVQKDNGPAMEIILTKGRMYLDNIELPDGEYEVQVRATDDEASYRAVCSSETLTVGKGMALKLKITVEDSLPEVDKPVNPDSGTTEEPEIQNQSEQQRSSQQSEKEEPAKSMPLAVFLVLMGAIAGYGIYRFRKGGKNVKGHV